MALVCVECGEPVRHLVRTTAVGQIILTRCGTCGETADRYLEFEPALLVLSLMLHRRGAYRHVLFNCELLKPSVVIGAHVGALLITSVSSVSWLACALNEEGGGTWSWSRANPERLARLLCLGAAQHAISILVTRAVVVGRLDGASDAAAARRVSLALACPCLGRLMIIVLAIFEADARPAVALISILTLTSAFQALRACNVPTRTTAQSLLAGLAAAYLFAPRPDWLTFVLVSDGCSSGRPP